MTGLVDAVSILGLGLVFVANMTGNVGFIGFALARAPFSRCRHPWPRSSGSSSVRSSGHPCGQLRRAPRTLLRNTCAVQFVLIAAAFVVALPSGDLPSSGSQVVVAALCAAAMGIQNTAARRLAVPDLTTTVLTMTLTGIASDVRRSQALTTVRRALAALTMLLGAAVGALSRAAHAIGLRTGPRVGSAWPGRRSLHPPQ